MNEKQFVDEFIKIVNPILPYNKFYLSKDKNLFYELTLDRDLNVKDAENQIRGKSAFQTDLILFEKKDKNEFPLVVFEFKLNPSTHDIMVYSTKARKHKQIYPWLRYGMFICGVDEVPIRKFLKHNEFLDFCVSVKKTINEDGTLNESEILQVINFIISEVENAKSLENILFEGKKVCFYQKVIKLV